MKVLLIVPEYPPYNIGGGGEVFKALTENYKKLGHEVFVIWGNYKNNNLIKKISIEKRQGVSFVEVPELFWGISFLKTVMPIFIWHKLKLKKIIKNMNPDFIHIHGYGLFMPAQVAKVCHDLGYKYIFTIHGAPISPAKMKNPIISLAYLFYKVFYGNPLLKNADRITAVSSYAADFFEFKDYRNKIEIIFNGINKEAYIKPDFDIYDRFGVVKKENTKIILSLGRIEWIKGFDKVIRLLPEMISNGYDPVYCIAGRDNGEKHVLEKLAKDLEVSKNLIFLGFLEKEDKMSALFNADVIALPSNSEAFPITALEARVINKPAITTFAGGLKDAFAGYKYVFKIKEWEKSFHSIPSILVNSSFMGWEDITRTYIGLKNKL
jgi:glycosyltransferase involved in cell wall biosynthesis